MNKMIATNLKIAFRSILRNKVQSIISILGLGIGLGSLFLLVLLIIHENSFNRYIPEGQHLYRVIQGVDCRTPYPLASAVAADNPLVEKYFRYYQADEVEIKDRNNEIIPESCFAFADTSILDCLGIRMMFGSMPHSNFMVVLSESTARRYLGADSQVPASLQVRLGGQFVTLTVSGVYRDFPSNSTIRPDFIANPDLTQAIFGRGQGVFGTYARGEEDYLNWDNFSFSTYLRLNPSASAADLADGMSKYKEFSKDENRRQWGYSLQNVAGIYLHSNNLEGNQFLLQGNAKESGYYTAIAAMILMIALFNYIFLTRAKMMPRLKELGAKKAIGASGHSIGRQIILESCVISLLSLIPATGVVIVGIPFLNDTLGSTLDAGVFSMWSTIPLLLLMTLFTGGISGMVIGFRISRSPVVRLLTGNLSGSAASLRLGNWFLSVHFILFMVLVTGVLFFQKQIKYAMTDFKAINPTNVIVAELNSSELRDRFATIKNEMDRHPGVLTSAGSTFIPPFNNVLPVKLENQGEKITFDGLIMGEGMTDLLGMELIEGASFGSFENGRTNVIFNESAAREYHLKAGEFFHGFFVQGIVKDFNVHSLHAPIRPMVIIQQDPAQMSLFAMKTDGMNDEAVAASVKKLFREISPDHRVNVYSLTDQIAGFYEKERHQQQIIGAISMLTVVLSVMGLLGMTLVTVTGRTKEIGVRKINGARSWEILALLNAGVLKWIAFSFVIATPIAWYAMTRWLESFAYKTPLSWWIFALAGLLALTIALLTVSWQSWKAATRNPVESLRYE
jgi:putative ABC transport system permease protein